MYELLAIAIRGTICLIKTLLVKGIEGASAAESRWKNLELAPPQRYNFFLTDLMMEDVLQLLKHANYHHGGVLAFLTSGN